MKLSTRYPLVNRILYLVYLLLTVFVLLEIILRIYNPFPFRIKGDQVVLPTNTTYTVLNRGIPNLEDSFTMHRNNLGFRGPDLPKDFDKYFSIITVGGSTTECFHIKEENTWPFKLQQRVSQDFNLVWLNNAGLAGHSTYGHLVLMNQYISLLKPKLVLMLVGCNDVNRADMAPGESVSKKKSYDFFDWIRKKSEVYNVVANLMRYNKAREYQLTEADLDLIKPTHEQLNLSAHYEDSLKKVQAPLIEAYKQRLKNIITDCSKNNIELVLITQPTPMGGGKDPVNGTDLDLFKVNDIFNGKLYNEVLDLYNAATIEVANERKVPLIDIAKQVPKSSAYVYDIVHFTNKGCDTISSILYSALKDHLAKKYASYKK